MRDDPNKYVDKYLTVECYATYYNPIVYLCNGENAWEINEERETIEPPIIQKRVGRPKKKRKVSLQESPQ